MAHGLNKLMIKRDISSSDSSNNNNSNYQQNNNNNFLKIEQSLNNNNNNNNTMIKREIIDCNTKIIINNTIKSQQNLLNNNKSIAASSSSSIAVSSVGGSTTNNSNNNNTISCGNTKMGSRRIFTPQFKLQVLESYRNDNDCKGNQRATARKYGIHRRQIQKWLQCEPNLRSSVANLNNQNNNNVIIKHQFHNISHHHNQQQSILTNLNSNNNNNQQYNKISSSSINAAANIQQLSLDSARHTVALNSIQTLSPPLSTTVSSVISSMAATTTQSSMTSISLTSSLSTTSPISIRSPTQINCNNNKKSTNNNSNSLLLHNQQQNTVPYLTHTPAINTSVSVPIPIIPSSSHSVAATAAAAAAYYHQYHLQIQHHHISNNNDIIVSHNQHNQQIDNCMPSTVSLPIPLNTATAAIHQHHHFNNTATTNTISVPVTATATINQINELRDYQPIYTTIENPIILSPNYEENSIKRHLQLSQDQLKLNCDNLYNDNHDYYQMQSQQQHPHQHQYDYIDRTVISSSPIDLSLGHKKEYDDEKYHNIIIYKRNLDYDDKKIINIENYTKLIKSKQEIESNNDLKTDDDSLIVDLSCRKRKIFNDKYEMPPAKVQIYCENIKTSSSNNNNNDQLNVIHQNQQQPKPVKLFKPYLLDDENNENNELNKSEQQDPIIWSHYPSSNYDSQCSSRGSNFHTGSPIEYPFPVGSPISNYHNNINNNNQHYQQSHIITSSSTAIQSPSSSSSADSGCNRSTNLQSPIPSVSSPRSPQTTFWCPKGSPVSGYDTASTYSDCSDYYKTTGKHDSGYYNNQQQQQRIVQQSSPVNTYSIDIKMHPVDSYYTNSHSPSSSGNLNKSNKSDSDQFLLGSQNGLYRNHHVQRWLDHDSADVRQGIAVYV